MNITEHPGWVGLFTTDEYPGAYRNGTRVVKVRTEPDDFHPVGTRATVLGSFGHPSIPEIMYCVEWDPLPRVAVAVIGSKLGLDEA